MSNELVALDDLGIKNDVAVFNELVTNQYLPRIQLMTAASGVCKKGEFPNNHYALVKGQNNIDLTESVDVLVLGMRPKALDTGGDDMIVNFDPASEMFAKIKEQSTVKDSGCMVGPEFLLYVPSIKEYGTFFMCSKSAQKVAPDLAALNAKAATLKSHFIEGKKYSWQAPLITACSTPFDIPPVEELKAKIEEFNNPKSSEIELAEESSERAR